jgi:hypothetical protein
LDPLIKSQLLHRIPILLGAFAYRGRNDGEFSSLHCSMIAGRSAEFRIALVQSDARSALASTDRDQSPRILHDSKRYLLASFRFQLLFAMPAGRADG